MYKKKSANNANEITNILYNLKELLKLATATVQCHSHTLVSSSWSVVVIDASGMYCPVEKVFSWPEHLTVTVSVHFHLQ